MDDAKIPDTCDLPPEDVLIVREPGGWVIANWVGDLLDVSGPRYPSEAAAKRAAIRCGYKIKPAWFERRKKETLAGEIAACLELVDSV